MQTIIAIDIGGTQIRVAPFRRGSIEPEKITKIPTKGAEPVIERLSGVISDCWPKAGSVERIVIALPGTVDPNTGIVYKAPNIPEWKDFPIKSEIEKRFGVETRVGNDANLAALGEWKYGAGQGFQDLIFITVSTGIGGGIISNGQLIIGSRGLASEIGHITVDPNGPLCGCGKRGHLEAIASGTGITNFVKEQLSQGASSTLTLSDTLNAKKIADAAISGDTLASRAIELSGNALGSAIASFAHTFNPKIIIIGGGVSFIGDPLFSAIHRSLNRSVMDPIYLKDLTITRASLGDNAGLMGAVVLGHLPPDR